MKMPCSEATEKQLPLRSASVFACVLLLFHFDTLLAQVISNNGASVSLTSGVTAVTMDISNGSGTITNNGAIQLGGAFVNGGTANGDGTCQLAGQWTNNGTFSPGSGTVTFNGSSVQNMNGSAATAFNNLVISNTIGVTMGGSSSFTVNGAMTVSSGAMLTIASNASITTAGTGRIILDSGAGYVNLSGSAPALKALTTITGVEGWRMLAAPDSVTVGSMFASPLVTQGFTGSNFPSLQPNPLWWDETSHGTSLQAWRSPSAASDAVRPGKGYMFYVFNGAEKPDSSGTYNDVLPLTMSASGRETPLKASPFNFGITATRRIPSGPSGSTYIDTNYADYGWNLIGNPTPSTIDWNASSGWTKTNIDASIYVWNPADTTGGYKTWNGYAGNLGSGLIAPFQAFWVKANADNPLLTCGNGVKTTGGHFLGKKTAEGSIPPPVLSLNLSADGLQAQSYLMFSRSGNLTYNPGDAFSLAPLTDKYLILYTASGQGQPAMQIKNLPDTGFNAPYTLPLFVGGAIGGQPLSGSFTLSWKLNNQLPGGLSVELMDDYTGQTYTMNNDGKLAFSYDTPAELVSSSGGVLQKKSAVAGNKSLPRPVVRIVPAIKSFKVASATANAVSVSRFRLVISAHDPMEYLPKAPELAQNYPNPFNRSTRIAFSIPVRSRVKIQLFNMLGRNIATVTDLEYPAGKHTIVWNAANAPSGLFVCRMITGNQTQTILLHHLSR